MELLSGKLLLWKIYRSAINQDMLVVQVGVKAWRHSLH
jgi:hypothetical protein